MNLVNKNESMNTETQKSVIKQQESKLQKFILDLNKAGLKLLTQGKYDQAIQFFKKAEKVLNKQHDPQQSNYKLIQLSGITYNNLACYYKKTKKPKVALKYLKKALQLEVYKLNNWTSIAGTHLNICAIYSYMKNHQQASSHAELAINFLQKISYDPEDLSDQAKSYWNVYMLSYYNLAIEKEYLKVFQQAIHYYKKSKEISQISGKRNIGILISCDESISRLEPMVQNIRKRVIQHMQKKQESDQKGFAQYIRLNKKNFLARQRNNNFILNEQQVQNYLQKVSAYNETPTGTAGNRFRSRKILNNSVRDGIGASFNNRVHSLTSLNKRLASQKQFANNQRKIRLMTQNDLDQRSQLSKNKVFIRKSHNVAKNLQYRH